MHRAVTIAALIATLVVMAALLHGCTREWCTDKELTRSCIQSV